MTRYFGNPWMLLWAAAIAVPILIHLLNRYRHKRIDWAAMELLRRALVIRARQIRIEDILVLVLRCLAVVFLASALARPKLPPEGLFGGGGDTRVGIVIALDASYSMAHRPGVNSRFERAVERVRQVLQTAKPGWPVTVVQMGSSARPLPAPADYDEARMEKLLTEARPLAERLNLELCLEEVQRLVSSMGASARECYIVTDAQANSWQRLSEKSKTALREIAQAGKLYYLSVGAETCENLTLSNFALASGTVRKGAMARFVAEVTNHGQQPQANVGVTLTLNNKAVERRVIDAIPPGQARSIPLFARLDEAGNNQLRAEIAPDPLATDNVRYAVAHVPEQVRVLAADGAPSSEPFKSETDYLATALSPRRGGPAAASLAVRVVPWLDLHRERLSDYHVVILTNLPDVRADQAAALHAYVEQGGGLIVFLGPNTIPRLLNERMGLGEKSLLPLRLTALASPKDPEGVPLEFAMPGHPVAAAIAGLPPELLNAARFTQYVKGELLGGGRTILKLATTNDPLLAEKSLGRGRVLLFASSASRAWTNLPVNPIYPILLHQAVTYLSRQEHERSFAVGEPINLTLPWAATRPGENAFIRDPAGKDHPVLVSEQQLEEGREPQKGAEGKKGEQEKEKKRLPAIKYTEPAEPALAGFYEVRYAAGVPPLVAAVNVEPSEGDVRCLLGVDLAKALDGTGARIFAWGDELTVAIKSARVGREFWWHAMLLALLMLLLEAFLAWHFSRRASAAAQRETTKEELLGTRAAEVKG